jgi:glycine oxidase
MAALSVTGDPPCRRIIYAGKSYLVPRSDGRLLIGATVEEAGFRKEVTAGGVLRLLKSAMDLAPVLRDYPVESTWAGLRPATPDGLPILGPTALEGYHLATGHFRNGILLTPLTGEWLTEAIATGQMPPSMQPFLLERFLKTEPDG